MNTYGDRYSDPHQVATLYTHAGRVRQDLAHNGATIFEIQLASGWKGERQVIHYTEQSMAGRGAMARLCKNCAAKEMDG